MSSQTIEVEYLIALGVSVDPETFEVIGVKVHAEDFNASKAEHVYIGDLDELVDEIGTDHANPDETHPTIVAAMRAANSVVVRMPRAGVLYVPFEIREMPDSGVVTETREETP